MFSRQATIFVILLLVLGLIIVFLLWPVYSRLGGLLAERDVWREKVAAAREIGEKIKILNQKYQNYFQAEKIPLVLPKGKDIPGLIVQLDVLTSINGFILNSIDFSDSVSAAAKQKTVSPTTKKEKEEAVSFNKPGLPAETIKPEYQSLRINLSLTGKVGSLKNFLKASEENLRIMDIEKISFDNSKGVGELSEYKEFNIGLITYYQ